jgi:hypothetical protein
MCHHDEYNSLTKLTLSAVAEQSIVAAASSKSRAAIHRESDKSTLITPYQLRGSI